jgi:hypothetical protein
MENMIYVDTYNQYVGYNNWIGRYKDSIYAKPKCSSGIDKPKHHDILHHQR